MQGIEGLAAKQKDFTFMQRLRNKATDVYLDQKRSDGEVPDNARFWEYFGPALKFSPELKHIINGNSTLPRFTLALAYACLCRHSGHTLEEADDH
jgi:hypothetical protein